MLEEHFPEIKVQIDEYYEFSKIVRGDKQLFELYPKILNLCITSLFEKQIKQLCSDVISKPKLSVFSPATLNIFISNCRNKPVSKIYACIEGYVDSNGQEILSMQKFYNLFGGSAFEQTVGRYFSTELSIQIKSYDEFVKKISACVSTDSKYESSLTYAENILQQLKTNTLQTAKDSFLRLKERRNRIAHDFMCEFNDTYNDIICLYNNAAIYVYALKKALSDLIDF